MQTFPESKHVTLGNVTTMVYEFAVYAEVSDSKTQAARPSRSVRHKGQQPREYLVSFYMVWKNIHHLAATPSGIRT